MVQSLSHTLHTSAHSTRAGQVALHLSPCACSRRRRGRGRAALVDLLLLIVLAMALSGATGWWEHPSEQVEQQATADAERLVTATLNATGAVPATPRTFVSRGWRPGVASAVSSDVWVGVCVMVCPSQVRFTVVHRRRSMLYTLSMTSALARNATARIPLFIDIL